MYVTALWSRPRKPSFSEAIVLDYVAPTTPWGFSPVRDLSELSISASRAIFVTHCGVCLCQGFVLKINFHLFWGRPMSLFWVILISIWNFWRFNQLMVIGFSIRTIISRDFAWRFISPYPNVRFFGLSYLRKLYIVIFLKKIFLSGINFYLGQRSHSYSVQLRESIIFNSDELIR